MVSITKGASQSVQGVYLWQSRGNVNPYSENFINSDLFIYLSQIRQNTVYF